MTTRTNTTAHAPRKRAKAPTWEILIPTIPHRHDKLTALLSVLEPQVRSGFGVIVYRDNLHLPYGPKCQALAEAATAEYISFLSDDDSVAPDFVKRVDEALEQRPDYVGFKVRFTQDGIPQRPVIHSLDLGKWDDQPDAYYRDIVHFNPIRRDLATRAPFTGHEVTDRDWADDMRRQGCVKTQVFIDDEIHYYQHTIHDFILTARRPMDPDDIPALPEYRWVRYL